MRTIFIPTDAPAFAVDEIQDQFTNIGIVINDRTDALWIVPAPDYPPILSPEAEQRATAAFDALREALGSEPLWNGWRAEDFQG